MLDKKDFIERMALKLKEWDAEADELKTRAEFAGRDEKARFLRRLAEVRELRHRGSEVLQALHEACEDEWDSVRTSAEELLGEKAGPEFRQAA